MNNKIQKISVIGAGILGHGIAQKFAMGRYQVVLNDVSQSMLEQAERNIANNVRLLNEAGIYEGQPKEVLGNISFIANIKDAIQEADLVIEAIPEELYLKKNIFHLLEMNCKKEAILASNSSSFLPDQYAADMICAEQVLGIHFFNPPNLLPLVEVIKGTKTLERTLDTVQAVLVDIGMKPIIIKNQSAGFIGNRLQFALLEEALKIVEEGIASPHEIDDVVKYGFGRRLALMGPFEVFDFGGWDTIAKVQPNITGKETSNIIKEKVANGHFGVKSGKGFYDWDENKIQNAKKMITKMLINIEKTLP